MGIAGGTDRGVRGLGKERFSMKIFPDKIKILGAWARQFTAWLSHDHSIAHSYSLSYYAWSCLVRHMIPHRHSKLLSSIIIGKPRSFLKILTRKLLNYAWFKSSDRARDPLRYKLMADIVERSSERSRNCSPFGLTPHAYMFVLPLPRVVIIE